MPGQHTILFCPQNTLRLFSLRRRSCLQQCSGYSGGQDDHHPPAGSWRWFFLTHSPRSWSPNLISYLRRSSHPSSQLKLLDHYSENVFVTNMLFHYFVVYLLLHWSWSCCYSYRITNLSFRIIIIPINSPGITEFKILSYETQSSDTDLYNRSLSEMKRCLLKKFNNKILMESPEYCPDEIVDAVTAASSSLRGDKRWWL